MKLKINKKKLLKRTIITIISIVVFFSLLILSLRLPVVQNFIKDRLVVYLENKIKTKVSLEKVYVAFPNNLKLQNLYLKGQDVDTLLAVRKLDVGLNMMKLMSSTADITSIDLEGVNANVVRNQKGKFNFDYIINAFATNDKEESSSKPFIISLNKIKLKDIGVTFKDQQSKNDIKLYFNSFDTWVKTFDLQKNNYAVGDINLDGLKLKLKQDLVAEVSEKVGKKVDSLNKQQPMKIGLQGIKLTNFNIDYGDENTKTFAKVLFKELSTKVNQLDLENNAYNIDNVLLAGADIRADLYLPAKKEDPKKVQKISAGSGKEKAMKVLLGNLNFNDVKVVYNNTAVVPSKQGMDYNHLNFSRMNVDIRNFKMENNEFAGTVKSAEIKESKGLDIQRLTTNFTYGSKEAYLKNLYLQTPKTILRDEVVIGYDSVEQLTANPGAIKVSASIRDSKVGFSDILNLVPALRNTVPFNKYPNAVLLVNANAKGSVNNLVIQNFRLSGIDQLKVAASGRVKNAMNPDQLYYDLKIGELSSSDKTIYNLVPKNTIPSNISLPSFFSVKGIAKGTTKNVNTNLNLTSAFGNAEIIAQVDMRRKNHELYDVNANLHNLQIGKIIQNKEVGAITAKIAAKGEGFDPKSAKADIRGYVNSAVYKAYNYRDMDLTGKINHGAYSLALNSKDPNANMNLAASGVYNEKNPTVKVNGAITKLDLNKLGFYEKPMIVAGKLDGDFSNLNPDELNGSLNLQNFAISDTKEVFPLQEVNFKAVSTKDSNELNLNSQIADITLTGKYKLTQIFGALQQTINQYYQFQKPGKAQKIQPGQHFAFSAKIKNDNLIRKFVPDLKDFETITLNGNYDADSQKIEVDGRIPQLQYGENSIQGGALKITNENQALQYNLGVVSLKSSSLALNKISVVGDVADNTINYNITTKDTKDATRFLIAGKAKSLNNITEISLNPDGLKLNYDDWTVAENNRIQISSKGILADNFRLSNAGSEILLQSENNSPASPLNVSLKDFKIETITEAIKKDSLLAKGTINGTAQLRDLTKKMTFTSDLNISDLMVYGSPVGNVAVKVKNNSANILNADVALSGNDNDVKILGDYNISAGTFDMNMAINQLQMKTVQGFSMNAIHHTEGYLSGNLKLTGSTDKPNILGKIKFNKVGLEIAKTGSDFRNIDDEIDFTNRGIEFNRFKVKDKDGNALTVNGQVLTQNYRDFAFNLNVNARDFKVVNSEKTNDAMMYGILAIDAGLRIRGNLDLPKVEGRLAVAENTDFTFVLPQSSPALQERDGIVEFVDQDQVVLNKTIKTDSLNAQSRIKGMDVSVNIEVNKEAKMSIVIDKANGDFVKLQGEAQLTGGIDPSGKTTLVGVYEVEKGAYELSVSMLKRKFDIQKGSTITWTGEPTAAIMDITAVYKTETAPIDLVEQQVNQGETNLFKQRMPFNALLKMKGELLKPILSFDITTDENNNSVATNVKQLVDAKLAQLRQQEPEMNKQVFALLLLNRFIGENPFQSSAGLSAETMARQSVSKILSQQLNNLASDLIKGVDLNFGLESTDDYSTGNKNTRTDLNVDISKKLLNDRLKVTVGSNFGLEGQARQNENMTNIAGDVTVDYSLSRDGRYMLRAYRKNDYQVALQGQIVETGIGFIITLDYDKFREIFQKSKKEKNRKVRDKKNQVVEFK
ncbi:translocation/assembly module TamB domain-containing protein [Elizabethkingia anophelis]|uniref:translocation/assembly module TamB domain-containing protein n=1 Tax=Elizabethkingia anophelis TaxID=1117645 RepID=UPI000994A733|nr:translocation/assembly module TamB domain-containing protein [Elizabethkingia anophelis]ASV78285.1 translocation/assembly module TamB [Elizabethkingia anophelis]EHM7983273.1 translocation/assembly module TamB domain-containing protein [Elizabethkingia anophelis]EHM8030396.1 translocation/assembly module TamB domain-containing protein [Elizabethkingia anophelis]EHZ9533150.1 translocation/assembly module TamB domain-containing protein [Elizabethkingia anophelis]EKU3671060.1 translocation/asse